MGVCVYVCMCVIVMFDPFSALKDCACSMNIDDIV